MTHVLWHDEPAGAQEGRRPEQPGARVATRDKRAAPHLQSSTKITPNGSRRSPRACFTDAVPRARTACGPSHGGHRPPSHSERLPGHGWGAPAGLTHMREQSRRAGAGCGARGRRPMPTAGRVPGTGTGRLPWASLGGLLPARVAPRSAPRGVPGSPRPSGRVPPTSSTPGPVVECLPRRTRGQAAKVRWVPEPASQRWWGRGPSRMGPKHGWATRVRGQGRPSCTCPRAQGGPGPSPPGGPEPVQATGGLGHAGPPWGGSPWPRHAACTPGFDEKLRQHLP